MKRETRTLSLLRIVVVVVIVVQIWRHLGGGAAQKGVRAPGGRQRQHERHRQIVRFRQQTWNKRKKEKESES